VIQAFAQDRDMIAWADVAHDSLYELDLRSGHTSRLGRATAVDEFSKVGSLLPVMALAGQRVLWAGYREGNSFRDYFLFAGSVGTKSTRQAVWEDEKDWDAVRNEPLAGDGPTLVYLDKASDQVWRVPGGRVPGTPYTVALAAQGSTFAAARAIPRPPFCLDVLGISPDGTRVLLYQGIPDCDQTHGQAVVVGLDGTQHSIKAFGPGQLVNAAWAPDSKRLALVSRAGQLMIYDTGTGSSHLLARLGRGTWQGTTWSPDGRFVGVTDLSSFDNARTLIVATGAGTHHALAGRNFLWSPDGRQLAFQGHNDLLEVAAADGTAVRSFGRYTYIGWGGPSALVASGVASGAVYLIPLDGSEPQLLELVSSDAIAIARTSPDGTHLYSFDVYGRLVSTLDLRTGDTVSAPVRVDPSLCSPDDYGTPYWSPDSRHLACKGNSGSSIIDLPSGHTTTLADFWPSGWLPDSQTLYGSDRNTGELEVIGRGGSNLRQITHTKVAQARNGVEIRRTSDGRLLHRFATAGKPRSLALTATRVAVLVDRTDKRSSIDLYMYGGSLLRSITVDRKASNLSMSGHWIVFAVATTIKALDTNTGTVRTLAHASTNPINPTIEGRRVAWAEQVAGPDVIRAVTLP
jgi:hypothetical protein